MSTRYLPVRSDGITIRICFCASFSISCVSSLMALSDDSSFSAGRPVCLTRSATCPSVMLSGVPMRQVIGSFILLYSFLISGCRLKTSAMSAICFIFSGLSVRKWAVWSHIIPRK